MPGFIPPKSGFILVNSLNKVKSRSEPGHDKPLSRERPQLHSDNHITLTTTTPSTKCLPSSNPYFLHSRNCLQRSQSTSLVGHPNLDRFRRGQTLRHKHLLEGDAFGDQIVLNGVKALHQRQQNPENLSEQRKWARSMVYSFPPPSTF